MSVLYVILLSFDRCVCHRVSHSFDETAFHLAFFRNILKCMPALYYRSSFIRPFPQAGTSRSTRIDAFAEGGLSLFAQAVM